MSELLKKQNYGVEVEFTGITRAMAAKAVAEVIGSTVTGPDHTCYHTRIIRDSQGRKWKIMRDSSIIPVRKTGNENMDEYRVEFVTPILKYDDLETLQAIIRKFREIGGVPHASCGIHIHVDGANHLCQLGFSLLLCTMETVFASKYHLRFQQMFITFVVYICLRLH
ncbi:amidoligase family protein [Blautia obeum]|uniref:amidoligase family protein n=1 Tax=Blautia obeum TaxID=40520 RepID=UPI001FC7C424|nr:amidoligase family protein [Blautia obeum]